MTSSPHVYMPWIDGLRAISILGVVAFHAGINSVSGGFTGVDVFFVISGFLIIGQIMTSLEAGNFSILGFYARRTMRILPPYFVMLAVVALIAPSLVVVPKAFEILAKAAVLAPLMVTNVLFYLEQGYFDATAEQKPLIHTWTLSVEEQFYLVIPVALILVYRVSGGRFGGRAMWIAGVAGIVSFLACIQFTSVVERNPAFYLVHLRAWEFIAGGLALPLASFLKRRSSASNAGIVAMFGLGLIGFAFFKLNGADPFPGWRAMIPVLGALLVLAGTTAHPQIIVAKALSHRVPVRIGLVSYSWYLWHWPLVSLAGLAGLGPDNWRGVLFAGVLGYIFAELSYKFVELPVKTWRHRRAAIVGDRKIFLAGLGAAIAVAALCGGITGLGYLRNMSWLEEVYGVTAKRSVGNGCQVVTGDSIDPECLKGKYMLLLGDSHADAVAPVFADEMEKSGIRLVVIARGACDPSWFTPEARTTNRTHRCANLIEPLETVLAAAEPPVAVIIISKFADFYSRNPMDIANLAGMFIERGTPALFVGPGPIFPQPALECVVGADKTGTTRDACTMSRSSFSPREASGDALISAGIIGLAHAAYAPIGDVFCNQTRCQPWDGKTLLYWDKDHVVAAGAKKIFTAIEPTLKGLMAK